MKWRQAERQASLAPDFRLRAPRLRRDVTAWQASLRLSATKVEAVTPRTPRRNEIKEGAAEGAQAN